MSRHITHFRRTALGATAPFACTALAACGDEDGNAGLMTFPLYCGSRGGRSCWEAAHGVPQWLRRWSHC